MNYPLLFFASFLLGSLPISTWLGKFFLQKDIRQFGDGNPGATNVFRAGSSVLGMITLMLDISKAALPVALSYQEWGVRGIPMFFIGIAPLVGNIFSPFLRFRGGKGLSVSLGIWIGLTLWMISIPAVIAVTLGIILLTSAGWAVIFALLVILIVILIWVPDQLLIGVWIVQAILLGWTHRKDLVRAPQLRLLLAKTE